MHLGNLGLCGNAAGQSTCYTHSTKQKHSNTVLIAVLVPVCGLLLLAIYCCCIHNILPKTQIL